MLNSNNFVPSTPEREYTARSVSSNDDLMNTKYPMRDFARNDAPKFRTEEEFDEKFKVRS